MPTTLRRVVRVLAGSFLLSCGGSEPASPPPNNAFTLRVVSGSAQTDSIGARLTAPLVAEVRYGDGRPGVGVAVRFVAAGTTGEPVALQLLSTPGQTPDSVAVIQTDATGRASVYVAYQGRVGTFSVSISATGVTATESAQFTVTPGRPHTVVVPTRDTLIYVGRTYAPGISVRDRVGNSLATALTSSSSACRIEATQVAGVAVGRCMISIAAPPLDSIFLSVVPVASLLAIQNDYNPFTSPHLVSMGLDGTEYRELATLTYQFPGELLMPLRAPDRRRITLHAGMGNYSTHITIFDSTMTPRTFTPLGMNSLYENWGRFSPDGQWIYFSARTPVGEAFSVWRARPDGTQAERITPTMPNHGFYSNYADVTPDGKSVVYVDGALYLNVVDIATGVRRALTASDGTPIQAYQLRISPDGRRVAFIFGGLNRFGTRVINLDGTGYRIVSTTIGYDNSLIATPLDWTPDGEWILTRQHNEVRDDYGGTIIFAGPWVLLNAETGAIVPLPYRFNPVSVMIDR